MYDMVKDLVGFEKPSRMPTYRILSKDDLYSIHWAHVYFV